MFIPKVFKHFVEIYLIKKIQTMSIDVNAIREIFYKKSDKTFHPSHFIIEILK